MELLGSSQDVVRSSRSGAVRGAGPRHSILDLAPLELECLSALWPMGEGSVRAIHQRLAMARPRAYTTVLTIMDRLAQKGIVVRRKVGRAYWYRATLSADEARLRAVEKIVAGFFEGSREALAAHLASRLVSDAPSSPVFEPNTGIAQTRGFSPSPKTVHVIPDASQNATEESIAQELDETLL